MKKLLCFALLLTVSITCFVESAQAQRGRRNARNNRGGGGSDNSLQVGELAPTFTLKSLDGESQTDLGSFRGEKPVVLFFGSYT